MTLLAHLSRNIQCLGLPLGAAPLIVAVSGGADSLALLHALHALDIAPLHVATLDHGLRGQDSADDAEHVRSLCESWGISVTVGHAQLAPHAPSLESRARRARYTFLAQVAHAHGAQLIAVAHHADDQAETVLQRLIRGTGLHGLSAMQLRAPLPYAPDLTLIRPLLTVTRAQIDAYCAQHGITPRHDASNNDTRLARNYIRHEVLPRLSQLNPQATRALNRLAESAALDEDYLREALMSHTRAHTQVDANRLTISRRVFESLHPALRRRWLRDAALRLVPNAEIPLERITAAEHTLLHGRHGANVQLGKGLVCRRVYDRIAVEHAHAPPLFEAPHGTLLIVPDAEYPLARNQALQLDSHTILMLSDQDDAPSTRAAFNAPDVPLTLRTRRAGDTFAPRGLHGHSQPLKKWLINHKIPRELRNRLALITHGNQVLVICWGQTWWVAESTHPVAATNNFMKISVISTL